MSQMRESESTDTALENNSLQIGNMDFQSSNNKNIGFATHTREDSTDATSWLDSHAASSARLELPNYFQKALLDKTVSVYQEKCLRGTFKTLVLVGPPGAGKTTLAKGFIEWMFRCYKEMNHESAYMLFDHQDVAQHNARKVLLRILRWLVGHEHDLNGRSYGTVQQAFAKYTPQEGHEWLQTASSCVDLLLEAIDPVQRKKRSFCIVLDALDEFSDDGELQVLCDQLARLQHELNLNVVLTTRFPDQRTSKALAQPCVERIAAEAPDILGFATKNFAVSAETVVNSLRPGAKKFESILNTIATASDGIFSSVQLNVGYIASARNADELDQLHSDLEEKRFDHPRRSDTGDLVHSDIDRNLRRVLSNTFELHESQLSESQQQILHIFSCVLFARRPLSVRELWAAVELKLRPNLTKHDKFNRSTELYLKTCGLIAQHDQLLTVHFTHPHLRTYLISKNEWRNQGWRIAQSCVDYMGLPVFRQGWCPWHIYQTTTSVWPFVRYAAAHWHHHYREFENQSHNDEECVRNSQQLFQSTMQFLSANKNVDYVSLVMVQLELLHYPSERPRASSIKGKGKMPTASSTKQPDLWYDSTRSYGLSGLLLASLYGMPRLVTKLLDRASLQQKDQLTIKNETSAYLAAISGDVETLREIIRKGLGTKTLNVRDTEGFPLICRAMLCGNMAIVDELLSKAEYNVDIGATIECEPLDEPYSLPDVGGDAKLVGVANRLRGYSLLHQAAVGGFTSVVDKLLELGARPNVQDAFGMTPLHKAAKYGHLEIVRLLVEKGQVDPVARVSNDQRTALHMASKYNRVEVASYLIARFPDLPSAKTSNDRLAIHHAVMAGSEGIAAMLLETQSKRPGLISQLGNLHMQDGKSASVGRRYTISLHTRSKENLSALSPSMNKLKHRNTASEEESATPRYNLRSAKRRYQGTARSPSPELPEFDPRHIDQIALPVGMASLAATELQDGDLSDETVDQTPTVDTMLGTDDVEIIAKTLQAHLKDLATGEWSWLVELEELGCSWPEMAEFLLEKRNQSPWIYFDPWVTVRKTPHVEFHVKGCVHTVLENPHGAVARSTRESSIASVHTKGLRRTIASLCGMAGVVPNVPDKQKWNGAVEFADVSEARIGYQIGDEALSTILARVQDVIAGLCTALAVIQEAHGCCDRFSVLCRNSVRPQVELLSVHFEDIVTLHDALQIADSRDLPSLQDCAEASRVVMRSFYFPKAASPTTEQGALHFCALTAQFLCLGLVLYSYAHCGPLDLFFLERELSKVELLGLGRRAHNQIYIMARTERLTCLDAMLNSPVIVFSLSSIEGLTADRLDVLASVSEVVDAWGPATITKSSRNDQVASVDIRGGTLYALGSEKGHWASHETLNHDWWVANWDRRNKLLVGAFLQTNVVCAPSEAMCLQALQGNWLPLGTGKAYWRQQERELGLQAGQHLIVTANVVWDKVPGSSMKSRLLDDLKYKREYLAFLDTPCGLRVSFCSGLAKRVRMRDLLADLMPIYIERQLLEYKSSHHWQILSDDYQVMDKLVNDSVADCASMFRNMNRSHPDCFTTFWKFAFDIILALKPTGLHADGKCFTVALIPNDPSEVMRGVSFPAEKSNFWTRTLQDTPSCATFAYFTLDCLQLSGHGCRNTQQWCRNVLLLETEVRPQVSESSRLAASPAWTPEDGICHTFGDRDAETKATLRVRVVRSPSHADPQLIVQRSTLSPGDWKRFIERRKHGEHLQEKISQTDFAHRAFITSTNNTAFNFL